MRIVFISSHCYLDSASGAAISTRQMMEMLSERGHDCRAFTTSILDYQDETEIDSILKGGKLHYNEMIAETKFGDANVLDLIVNKVRVSIFKTESSRHNKSPNVVESKIFLELCRSIFERFSPDLVLTYGGHAANLQMMFVAKEKDIRVIFLLRNLAYYNAAAFENADGILVASNFVKLHYKKTIGITCEAIPSIINFHQSIANDKSYKYATFVNPSSEKGAVVFCRIAKEMQERNSNIPFLVVESRGRATNLSKFGIDLSGLKNLNVMNNVIDVRSFYSVSRVILMPSLWQEPFGRVAVEGLANGLPVIASNRGGLPETLGSAGICLEIPSHCTPGGKSIPSAEELLPWLDTLERLWNDTDFESKHRELSKLESMRYMPDKLITKYEEFFKRVIK